MFEEAKQLAERGHKIVILSGRTSPQLPTWRTVDGVAIRSVKCLPGSVAAVPRLYYYLTRMLFPFVSAPLFIWMLWTSDKDVVIDNCSPHPSFAAVIAQVFSTPVIGLVHEYHD